MVAVLLATVASQLELVEPGVVQLGMVQLGVMQLGVVQLRLVQVGVMAAVVDETRSRV